MKLSLLFLAASTLMSTPSFAMYHGSSNCVYQDKNRKIELSARTNAEGAGFSGLRLTIGKKTKVFDGSAPWATKDLSRGDSYDYKVGQRTLSFKVVSQKVTRDDSQMDACSIEDSISSKVEMLVTGISAKPERLQFSCNVNGFNAQMSLRCGEAMDDVKPADESVEFTGEATQGEAEEAK